MHHSRRKLGHASTNSSMTDVRKDGASADPSRTRHAQTSRKSNPQTLQKLGKSSRDRERACEEEQWWDDERESFPQFCMTCEKQFIAQDERFLYCSEACRKNDQSTTTTLSSSQLKEYGDHNSSSLSFYPLEIPETRDIIPRASPSRPSSNFSPPTTPTTSQYPSAISALRSLNIRPPSPPSPLSISTSIWPFARSATTSPNPSCISNVYSSTYDGGHAGGYEAPAYNHPSSSLIASDRPLPSKSSPAYSRPKSIALVTPMLSR
ncbi:hypothetical protein GGS21DRAFT_177583 [Xylaria nigripes]|nr:hypothetical protein GGS21DRAFT_177583 [Xylaria nigripes]